RGSTPVEREVAAAAARAATPAACAPRLGRAVSPRDTRPVEHLPGRRRGAVARVRGRGVTVRELDAAPPEQARELLTACCGAAPWVEAMLAARPFGDRDRLLEAADHAWASLTNAQLADAIARHPRLGESRAKAALSAREHAWSAGEQSDVGSADDGARAALV